MAERRMFAKTIIDSDAFIDMPVSAQALYFHLAMRADDDGFVNSPKKIQRMVNASDDDLKILIAKRFLIPFDSGVVVIKHWKIHNYIQGDRYKPTVYAEEKAMLDVKPNKAYTINASTMDTECIQNVSKVETQVRLGKDSIGKVSIGEESIGKERGVGETHAPRKTKTEINLELLEQIPDISDDMHQILVEWLTYKGQNKKGYTERGLRSLVKLMGKNVDQYGVALVHDVVEYSMGNEYQGIVWDRLKEYGKAQGRRPSGGIDWDNV